jgi:two-component system NtrC family sensor kinase
VPISDPNKSSRTILAVEDNDLMGFTIRMLLEGLGYMVEHVRTARQALDKLEGASFDLLFTDVMMPGEMNGIELAKTVRKSHPTLPIVLTTGYYNSVEGIDGFPILKKPYDLEALAQTLKQALSGQPT